MRQSFKKFSVNKSFGVSTYFMHEKQQQQNFRKEMQKLPIIFSISNLPKGKKTLFFILSHENMRFSIEEVLF